MKFDLFFFMITKFKKYNLILEKSTLDVLFGNRDFTREFYKKFDIIQKFKWKKLDITQFKDVKEFEEFFRYYLTTFIVDTKFDILVFKRNIDLYTTVNDKVWFYNYNKRTKSFSHPNILLIGDIYHSLTIAYKDIIKDIFICDITMINRTLKFSSHQNDNIKNEFELYYKKLFIKLYNSYLSIINELLNKTDYKTNFKYYNELLKDNKIACELINNIYAYNSPFNGVNIKYDLSINMHKIVKLLYEENNKLFSFLRYKNWDKELSKGNIQLFNEIKNIIFDPKLIKKYKHLYNSQNFDLI